MIICNNYKYKSNGLTLIELIIAIALLSILAAVSIPSYTAYIQSAENDTVIKQIRVMELIINAHAFANKGIYPLNLAEVGLDGERDIWGNPYGYLNIAATNGNGPKRKDRNLVPINSDYDLYSNGPDGRSVSPLTAQPSRDDIVRANNGRFIGVAEDY
jgi:general secretion pathway protein G